MSETVRARVTAVALATIAGVSAFDAYDHGRAARLQALISIAIAVVTAIAAVHLLRR